MKIISSIFIVAAPRSGSTLLFETLLRSPTLWTIGGESHAIFQLHNLPVDFTVVGTIHSHPSPDPRPSPQDLEFFQRIGYLHIIVAHPYDDASWRAWDRQGEAYPLTVVE